MLYLVTDQKSCDEAYNKWTEALKNNSIKLDDDSWLMKERNVVFGNYGHGDEGEIVDQVMFGSFPDIKNGIVKIVRPIGSGLDNRKKTILAKNEKGSFFLLREGRLQKNFLSPLIAGDDFTNLSGQETLQVFVENNLSTKNYYLVASLDTMDADIANKTADFVEGCTRARIAMINTPTGTVEHTYRLGVGEKGGKSFINFPERSTEVYRLQGYVYETLERIFQEDLIKLKRNGYEIDAFIKSSGLLLEIKTGTNSQCVYEAVGQLKMYPHLIGLDHVLKSVLLIPDHPPVNKHLSDAIESLGIELHTYSATYQEDPPLITISDNFLKKYGP